ncbi:DUF2306 domain-containing protein [Nonomuraea sp. NPDC050556]|uniref:DUF2306 domain-containing protein n=1 Tax=Nonomuraea sp. NPDC050556 TaxID=3364369 RepID=UPI0037A1AAE9
MTRHSLAPAALIALSAIPIVAGALRMTELAGGPALVADGARHLAAPVPVMVHIVSVTLYSLLGAFQFRRRKGRWHRVAGRVLIPAGLLAALTGMWMTLFSTLPAVDGPLLGGFRLVFGTAMAASIVLGLVAIRRRDFAAHRAWMIRAYAIGLGAGTQAVTQLPLLLIMGELDELSKALMMAAGWVINLVVAEWIIRLNTARLVRPHDDLDAVARA